MSCWYCVVLLSNQLLWQLIKIYNYIYTLVLYCDTTLHDSGAPSDQEKKNFKQRRGRMVEKITLDSAYIHTCSTTLYMHSMLGPEELEVCQEPEVV